jgi:hypothetical protein
LDLEVGQDVPPPKRKNSCRRHWGTRTADTDSIPGAFRYDRWSGQLIATDLEHVEHPVSTALLPQVNERCLSDLLVLDDRIHDGSNVAWVGS